MRHCCDNQQEAQHAVTECFVTLYNSSNSFANEAAVGGWLRVTVRTQHSNYWSKIVSDGIA